MKTINIKDHIPDYVLTIMDTLLAAGYSSYLIGGCIRDMLTGKTPQDFDIATSASPSDNAKLFDRVIMSGAKHGTVTVIIGHKTVEITTFRIEQQYTDHRHPDNVTFTSELALDLSRRDFTINALALERSGKLIDIYDGISDINSRIIRCVGNPDQRFKEDALRLMRCIRFSAQLGFDIEPDTYKSITNNHRFIMHVSNERINGELCKIILSDYPDRIYMLYETGIINIIMPEVSSYENFGYYLKHYSTRISYLAKFLSLRLACLFYNLGLQIVNDIMKRLRFDKNTLKLTTQFLEYSEIPHEINGYIVRKIMSDIGKRYFPYIIQLWSANDFNNERVYDIKLAESLYNDTILNSYCISLKDLAINGDDLIGYSIPDKKNIGCILNKMLEIVLLNPQLNDKDYLLKVYEKGLLSAGSGN